MPEPLAGVIDASTLAGILFGEPEAAGLALDSSAEQLFSTSLLAHEFANICVKKHWRAGLSESDVLDVIRVFESLPVHIAPLSQPEVVAVAIRYQLSAYDAGYLWLALVKDIPLHTLDRKLANAYQLALKEIA